MDYEQQQQNSDIIFEKVTSSIENSTSILHKKAVALIKGLKEQLKSDQTKGINGIKNYTKSLMSLLDELFLKIAGSIKDEIVFEENTKNADALIFCLAFCIKLLPANSLKGAVPKVISILKNFLSLKRFEIRKYTLVIVEKITLSYDLNELKNIGDSFVEFMTDFYLDFIGMKNEEIQKLTVKSLTNILRNKSIAEALKFSLVNKIKNFFIAKIRGIKLLNNPSVPIASMFGTMIDPVQIADGEMYLKSISLLIQCFPFDFINELITELSSLIEVCDDVNLLKNVFLCFDLAFSSKSFAIETSEKIFKNILAKEIITDLDIEEENHKSKNPIEKEKDKNYVSFGTSFLIAFIKALTSIFGNINRTDPFVAVKYLSSLISILGEYLSYKDSFVKNNIINCIENILIQIFSNANLEIFYAKDKAANNINNNQKQMEEPQTNLEEDVIEAFNVDLEKVEKFSLYKIYEDVVNVIFYLISDRYEDLKPGFNILLLFIEKTHKKKYYELTKLIIENVLMRLMEADKLLNKEPFKIFLGKLFNFVHSSEITKYFQLQVLDFDIFSEEYTETSRVWIISYVNRFLKSNNDIQTMVEFYKSFFETIDDLEKIIRKIKDAKAKKTIQGQKENMDVEMENDLEEFEDEKYIVENDTEYNQNLKLKRYELILNNIWDLFIKFLNHDNSYSKHIAEIFVKLYNNLKDFPYLKEKTFKCVTRIISNSIKENDEASILIIREQGRNFFKKAYSTIFNSKFTFNESREAFNLISNFCKICSENYLKKVISEIINLFEENVTDYLNLTTIQGDDLSKHSNIAKLNEPLQFDEEMKNANSTTKKEKDVNDPKAKKLNILCLRIEVINYILKNMIASQTINDLVNAFFEKYFFNEALNHANLKKKLIELFITLMDKLNDVDQVLFIFHNFSNKYKGLEQINTKQKAKLFEFVLECLLKKIEKDQKNGNQIDSKLLNENFHIFVEIISLTKDLNRKVRNLAYEMIGKLTEFMQEINLYYEWVKIILGILASNSVYLKSAGINALARIFWQTRTNKNLENLKIIMESFDIVLLFFKEGNKEIIKSIYLFIRVLLYVLKTNFIKNETTQVLINKIIHYCFIDASKDIQKEFKVKNRNLLKTLIINFSFEEIKKICPAEIHDLVFYVNKHMVKKIKNITKEEEEIYGKNLDYSVIMDNDEFYIDEEEEFIDKEFKKVDRKKDDEELFLEKINKFNIYEDDPELLKNHNLAKAKDNQKGDKIEELFKKDNVFLILIFYILKALFYSLKRFFCVLNNSIYPRLDYYQISILIFNEIRIIFFNICLNKLIFYFFIFL